MHFKGSYDDSQLGNFVENQRIYEGSYQVEQEFSSYAISR